MSPCIEPWTYFLEFLQPTSSLCINFIYISLTSLLAITNMNILCRMLSHDFNRSLDLCLMHGESRHFKDVSILNFSNLQVLGINIDEHNVTRSTPHHLYFDFCLYSFSGQQFQVCHKLFCSDRNTYNKFTWKGGKRLCLSPSEQTCQDPKNL